MYYIDIKLYKTRITYNTKAERDADFTKIVNFFRTRGFAPGDGVLKRVDSLTMTAESDTGFTKEVERDVEIQ